MTSSVYNISVFPRNPEDPTDPTPSAPVALLPAPSAATLAAIAKAARRERALARERVLRRKAAEARIRRSVTTQHNAISLFAIALPACAGMEATIDFRERTATIRMQERLVEMAGGGFDNPNDAHRALLAKRGIEVRGWVPGAQKAVA